MQPRIRILYADDDPLLRVVVPEWLSSPSWVIETAGDGQEALERLRHNPFDVAILDYTMPYLNGMEVLKSVRAENIPTEVIILTAYGTVDMAVEALKTGAKDFLQKPVDSSQIVAAIRTAFEHHMLYSSCLAERFEGFLKGHATDPSLKMNDLCQHYRISSRYISRIFREHIGASFRERLQFYRIEKAKHLLQTTDDPLYIIAEQCGFKNQRRFAETFHKQEGVNPRRYREIGSEKRK